MKRILITGGAGMIGSNLVKKLVRDKAGEVKVADNLWRGKRQNLQDETGRPIINMENDFLEVDLRTPDACAKAVKGVDEIYHLADIVAGIGYVFDNQTKIFHDNALIDTNILKAAAQAGVKRFLYMGTACSYPKSMQYGVDAPALMEDDIIPAEPESAYGWSKLAGELQTELYGQETKMQTGILRCHNVYGTPTDLSPNTSQVIPALIVKAALYPSQEFIVWGSGSQGRSFLHVDDVVNGLVLMMEKGLGNGTIQIGTNYCTSIRELAEMIVKISGKNIKVNYDLTKPEGDKGRCADCSKAEKILSWKPEVTLEDGLGRLYNWVETRV
jgi:nucleoside-diphosphate-sugar epimerase